MPRNTESMLRSLDRITSRDLWDEIENRALDDAPTAVGDGESRGGSSLMRFWVAFVALALFAGAAGLMMSAFRASPEPGVNQPAGGNRPIPDIVPIDDGYRLYTSAWLGIQWEMVALPVSDGDIDVEGCGDSELIVAYRDDGGTSYQSCPSPYFSAQVFMAQGSRGALVVGTVATNVSRIELSTDDGRSVPGLILPMDTALSASFNAFAIEVPAGTAIFPASIVARDDAGVLLQQKVLNLPTLPAP